MDLVTRKARSKQKYTKAEMQAMHSKASPPAIWKGLRVPFDYSRSCQPLNEPVAASVETLSPEAQPTTLLDPFESTRVDEVLDPALGSDSAYASRSPSGTPAHFTDLGTSIQEQLTDAKQLSAQGYVPHTELYSGLWSNINQGLTGASRDILATYWQQTINHLETETHDFKIHQLPLARIKKVMKADPEVKMISAEAPILFAKGCDIFITELTMRAWIHAEDNKRRTLQRSDIAAALGKSDMFDFLIDIVPREESGGHGGGSKRPNTSGGQTASQAQATQPAQQQAPPQQMAPPDYGQMHHGGMPQDQQYGRPGMGYPTHMGGDGQQDPTQQYGQPTQMFAGQDMYNPYAAGQNFGGQVSKNIILCYH